MYAFGAHVKTLPHTFEEYLRCEYEVLIKICGCRVFVRTHFARDVSCLVAWHKVCVILSNLSITYAGYHTYLLHSVGNRAKNH